MDASLDALACFLPTLIQRRLQARPGAAPHDCGDTFPAALLFADISGFSALASRLAEPGREGAEELNRILNTYYGPLVELVIAHGGDIVNFAGDAILAVWPAESDALATAVRRAAQAS